MVSEQSQLDRLHDPVMAALVKKGFDKQQMEALLKNIAKKIESEKMYKLPPGILSENNMQFLLNREIKQHMRYKTPFSSIMLSAEGIVQDEKVRRPTADEHNALLPKLFSIAKSVFRDIDLIGELPEPHNQTVFSLLSMTDGKGAQIARVRLLKKIGKVRFKVDGGEAGILVATSLTVPEPEKKYDLTSYLTVVYHNHEVQQKKIAENHHLSPESDD
jgi:hypothetical protein